jgi:cytochrome o ubiquinol oxidase operon protein cyoD
MVMAGGFSRGILVTVIAITAVAQVLVQLVYFLHMNTSSEQRWNLIAFIYTILCIAVLLSWFCVDYELPTLQHDDLN